MRYPPVPFFVMDAEIRRRFVMGRLEKLSSSVEVVISELVSGSTLDTPFHVELWRQDLLHLRVLIRNEGSTVIN